VSTIVVVSTGFHAEQYVASCIKSVIEQTVQAIQVLLCDDDATLFVADQACRRAMGRSSRVCLRRGDGTSMESVFRVIHTLSPSDIVAWLDADDWLACPEALETVRDAYESGDVWLTYGSFSCWPGGATGKCAAYPPEVIASRSFRHAPWVASHLKTFRAGLFQRIREQDLRKPDGSWITESTDRAAMWPMLEMAGERHRFIEKVLVEYNVANSASVHNADGQRLKSGETETERLRAIPVYPRHDTRPW
jgi:glycosyltransferase involved in cell wall biosynthesis